jgi:hypothetical protein
VTPPHASALRPPQLRRVRAVTVPAQGFGVNPPIITSPGRLCGWSLASTFGPANAVEASIQGVAAAAATLTMAGFQLVNSVTVSPAAAWPAGANVVTVSNVQGGPVIVEIPGGTEQPVVITFSPPAGVTGTPAAAVPAMAGGPAYTIVASGASSLNYSGAVYAAAALVDGGQVVGEVSVPVAGTDTRFLTHEGIYIGTSLAFNVSAGNFVGCIYWADDWHGGDN